MKKIIFLILTLSLSCSSKKDFSLEQKLKNGLNDRFKAKKAIKILTENPKMVVNTQTRVLLLEYLKSRASWFPVSVTNILLREKPDNNLLNIFSDFLNKYPAEDYYPPRDDQMFELALKNILKYGEEKLKKQALKRVLNVIDNMNEFVDPLNRVKIGIIKYSLEYLSSVEARTVFEHILLSSSPRRFSVDCQAVEGLSVTGFDSDNIVMIIIPMLYMVKDGESGAVYASMALSAAQGNARKTGIAVLRSIITKAGDIIENPAGCPAVFGKESKNLCNVFKDVIYSGQLSSNTVLFESTAIRALNFMGEFKEIMSLYSSWSGDSLTQRWAKELYSYTMKTMENPDLAKLALRRDSIPSFDRDLAIRNELMITLAENGMLRDELLKYATVGKDTTIQMPVVEALSMLPPDKDVSNVFQLLARNGTVEVTESIYYSVLRGGALNAALEDQSVSAELSRIWNKETTNKTQWQKTRHIWVKFLLKELKYFKDCTSGEHCFTPSELFRLSALRAGWKYCDAEGAKLLAEVKVTDILDKNTETTDATGLELVRKPWTTEEAGRQDSIKAIIQKNINKFNAIHLLLKKCESTVSCYAQEIKTAPDLEVKVKAARMFRNLAKKDDAVRIIDIYEKASPEGRGELIHWMEKNNPGIDVLKKLMKSVKKLEEAGADYVNNMKLRILFHREKRRTANGKGNSTVS
ncbi:hypothetical protein KKF34_16320 [Myxococcota bacterium]|nr:hypothetical protein [Myxococcota bacterium]MBU1382325.1 hypothetical protein [Myxococcota bacterium]MBU1498443.1 hypothetical protein [Myxococcota bacterium]